MKNTTGLEIECFVHGAFVLLLFRTVLNEQYDWRTEGNRGECAQPCRLPYRVENRKSARSNEPERSLVTDRYDTRTY